MNNKYIIKTTKEVIRWLISKYYNRSLHKLKVSDKTIPLFKRKKELNKGVMKSLHFIK